jgi:hypothetical protein
MDVVSLVAPAKASTPVLDQSNDVPNASHLQGSCRQPVPLRATVQIPNA